MGGGGREGTRDDQVASAAEALGVGGGEGVATQSGMRWTRGEICEAGRRAKAESERRGKSRALSSGPSRATLSTDMQSGGRGKENAREAGAGVRRLARCATEAS